MIVIDVPPSGRLLWVVWAVSLIACSWPVINWTHEVGHVLSAELTGGEVSRVVPDPRTFARTEYAANPTPLAVVWSGPVTGTIAGVLLALALLARRGRVLGCTVALLGATCLLANGAYIGLGAINPIADTEVMSRLGVPRWGMAVFGIPVAVAGRAVMVASIGRLRGAPAPRREVAWVTVGTNTLLIGLAGVGLALFPDA
ncbi:MAG: M50 family metallopeptidase [Planctomycetota bacterium]